ncbi:MAG: RluA family pseudouridine synthase [Candidatus Adiutrix sp.]|jgi:23S rRNA pseudouridine1911/1915/1917 synthase|nr:RluA family pseudouridine synthase [Candidatus Adiutrix sp.]
MRDPVIIYEDNHLLIAQKPPGFLAQPDGGPRPNLLGWAERYLARHKPGRAFVGLTHRLDRPVGGVMALAKTSKCAARLSRQFRERAARKFYLALVDGRLDGESGRLEQRLVREGALTRPAAPGEEGRPACLDWRLMRREGALSLLGVNLHTGFKHQIRAQLAALGCPVAGDAKYGSAIAPEGPAIGLWAATLTIEHPVRREMMTFESDPPDIPPWTRLGSGFQAGASEGG